LATEEYICNFYFPFLLILSSFSPGAENKEKLRRITSTAPEALKNLY